MRRTIRWPALLLAALPPVGLVAAALAWTYDIPQFDEWAIVDLLDRYYDGTLKLVDFWRLGLDPTHRPFFTRLVIVALAIPTRWNLRFEQAVHMLLGAAAVGVLLWFLRATARQVPVKGRAWLPAVTLLLACSFTQAEYWLWCWKIETTLCLLPVLAALGLLCADKLTPSRFVAVLVLSSIATLSYTPGMAVWPLIPFALLVRRSPGWRWMLPVSLLAAAAAFAQYLWSAPLERASGLSRAWSFALGTMGTLLTPAYWRVNDRTGFAWFRCSWSETTMAIIGGAGLLAFCALLALLATRRSPGARRLLPVLLLGGFSAIAAAGTGVGRAAMMERWGPAPRYGMIVLPFWVALTLLCAITAATRSGAREVSSLRRRVLADVLPWLCAGAVVTLGAWSSAASFQSLIDRDAYLAPAIAELERAGADPQIALLRRFPPRGGCYVQAKAELMMRYRLGMFRHVEPAPPPIPRPGDPCRASDACRILGLCYEDPDTGECRTRSVDDCRESRGCSVRGACISSCGKCVAASPSDCRHSLICRERGLCGLTQTTTGLRCLAELPEDCEHSRRCQEEGACILLEGQCVTPTEANRVASGVDARAPSALR